MFSTCFFLQEFHIIMMSNPIVSDTITKNNVSEKNDNVIGRKSVITEKTHVDNNVAEWSIVHFVTDDEEDIEGFNDLIPSSWITTTGTLCWYPMNEHQATTYKLVKQCAKANLKWNCFSVRKIEVNIGKCFVMIICHIYELHFY